MVDAAGPLQDPRHQLVTPRCASEPTSFHLSRGPHLALPDAIRCCATATLWASASSFLDSQLLIVFIGNDVHGQTSALRFGQSEAVSP